MFDKLEDLVARLDELQNDFQIRMWQAMQNVSGI